MKISLEWLAQYMPQAAQVPPQQAADALMQGGLPVECIEKIGGDTVLDVEVTSNRSDCLCHLGVARELAALLGAPFNDLQFSLNESPSPASGATSVQIQDEKLCPYYSARIIRGVKVGPSPTWLVRRLEAIGLRAINNVVDVTNYVMMELGQPLHAFDYDKLAGGRIVVRRAQQGEKLLSIDGRMRDLTPDMLVIADAAAPVAIAGVMGGKESEVGERTVNVLLESARFDPLSVRRTSRGLALRSDSSYRFERGIDPLAAERASQRAAQLILETAGGQLLRGVVAAGQAAWPSKPLALRLEKIKQVLGIDVAADEAVGVLSRLGFSPALKGPVIEIKVPSHRLDVNIEVDLVEEIARVIGYDRIPVRQAIEIVLKPPQPELTAVQSMRRALEACGYFEALTFTWVDDRLREDFRPAAARSLLRAEESVRKENATLRTSLIPGLLDAVLRNQSVGNPQAMLFETGSTFWVSAEGKIDERRRLALVGSSDYREVRGAVESLLEALDPRRPVGVTPSQQPGFSSAACGQIAWGEQVVGTIGRIDAAVVQKLDLRETPVAAELELVALIQGMAGVSQVQELGKFPAIRRDLSLVVEDRVRYQDIESSLKTLALPWLEQIEYVTTYRGKQVGSGKKSVSVQLVFRNPEKTLTSEEVESSVGRAIAAAKEKGWALRE